MPAAIKYIPPTDKARDVWVDEVRQERQKKRERYREAVKYYSGNHDEQLAVMDDAVDDNVVVNLVQMTADRTVSFLFPEMPHFVTDPKGAEDTPEEEFLRLFFEENGGLKVMVKWALRGFLAGHTYIRVRPPKYEGKKPILTVLDPTAITVYWSADDTAEVLWYEYRYYVGNVAYIEDTVKNPDGKGWTIHTYSSIFDDISSIGMAPTAHGEAGSFWIDRLTFGPEKFERAGKPRRHDSEISPIVDVPHLPHPDDYYGLSEFTQKNLQDTINRLVSVRNQIARENAEPVDVITGMDAEDIQEGPGGILTIASANAKINRLEMKGDMQGIGSSIDKLIEIYLAIARVVLLKGEAKDLQRVTNASVRTLFLDALSKNELLRSSYGEGLVKVAKVALEMGFAAKQITKSPTDLPVTVKFGTPLPVDDTEIANINAIGISNKFMSLRTAATRLGLDWVFEVEAMKSEKELLTELQPDDIIEEGTVGASAPTKNSASAPKE